MAITTLANIQPQPLHWLWQNYIPRGRLTLLCADPGTGKSLLTHHLASLLSNARPLP